MYLQKGGEKMKRMLSICLSVLIGIQLCSMAVVSADKFKGAYVCTDDQGYDYYIERTVSFSHDLAVVIVAENEPNLLFFTYIQQYDKKKMIGKDVYTYKKEKGQYYWQYHTSSDERWRYVQSDSVQDKILYYALGYIGRLHYYKD